MEVIILASVGSCDCRRKPGPLQALFLLSSVVLFWEATVEEVLERVPVHVLLDTCREMFPSPGFDNLRCGLWFPNFTLPLYHCVTDYDFVRYNSKYVGQFQVEDCAFSAVLFADVRKPEAFSAHQNDWLEVNNEYWVFYLA